MPPEISMLQLPDAAMEMQRRALPARSAVSAETRRLLMALLEDEDEEDDVLFAAPIADMAAYRARRALRTSQPAR